MQQRGMESHGRQCVSDQTQNRIKQQVSASVSIFSDVQRGEQWPLASTGSVYRGEHPPNLNIEVSIPSKNEYGKTTMGGALGREHIQSRSFVGVGAGHPQVSAQNCSIFSYLIEYLS